MTFGLPTGDVQPARPARPPLGWAKTLAFSLTPLIVLIIVAETAARVVEVWHPPLVVDFEQGFDRASRAFVPSSGSPGLLVTHPEKISVFRPQEFAERKPRGTLRVVAVGESSVNYLEDELRLMERHLQERLSPRQGRVEVINAGALSYGSRRLSRVVDEVLNYQPDLVLLYLGNNEFEEVEQYELARPSYAHLRRAMSHSAVVRLIRDRITAREVERLQREHELRARKGFRPDHVRAWTHRFTMAEVHDRMAIFRRNLAAMIDSCRARGVPVILGTIPSNLARPYLPKESGLRYEEVRDLIDRGDFDHALALGRTILAETAGRHQSSDLENQIIRELARQYEVPLVDVEARISAAEPHGIPGETLFADHCHLNAQGNAIWREAFEDAIVSRLGGVETHALR